MKRLWKLIARLFKKNESSVSFFSEAVADGFIDLFKEMGYKTNGSNKKEKTGSR